MSQVLNDSVFGKFKGDFTLIDGGERGAGQGVRESVREMLEIGVKPAKI
jgi:hypothetical protein